MEKGQVEWEWNERTENSYLPKQVKKNCLGLRDKIWKPQTNTFMVCGVGSTLIGVKNGLTHTQIVHLKIIPGNSNIPTNNPVFLSVSLHPCRGEAARKFFLTEVYTIQGLSKLTMKCTGFSMKWHLRNKWRNSLLMMCHYPDLRSTVYFWLLVPQGKFASANQKHYRNLGSGITSGGLTKYWLFSQANICTSRLLLRFQVAG